MLDQKDEFQSLVYMLTEILKTEENTQLLDLLQNAHTKIEQTDYDGWNGGTHIYTIYLTIDIRTFVGIKDNLEDIENRIVDKLRLVTRHRDNEFISRVSIVPKTQSVGNELPNPHRAFSAAEQKRREDLLVYLSKASEDALTAEVLLPLFRQLGFHRITAAEHKDKSLEYGKDIWMKYVLPTQHVLYFGVQVKKGKLDSSGVTKASNANIAEVHNQVMMMLGHEIFDSEIGKKVLVDHAFIVAGGEITKAARNWLGGKLDVSKRSQIMFMDRDDIVNLFVVTNLPLPPAAINRPLQNDDLPF